MATTKLSQDNDLSTIANLMLMLPSSTRHLLGRTIPTRRLTQRFIDRKPSQNRLMSSNSLSSYNTSNPWLQSTMAFAAATKRRELIGDVGKRIDIPITSKGELGTSAGESTEKAAAWACPCWRCCRWKRSHGRRSDWGPLSQLGATQSGASKRPLDQDSDASDTGLPDAKIPKTGAGPDSDDAPDDLVLEVRKDKEQVDFDNILATKLGRMSQTMLRNTPVGKQIVSLNVGIGRNAEDPSLDFLLG
ncbi:hypothetical protein V490_01339 [Pseudogymnoascus sp. VKM F-3557]|nr:hypothetical protein V490_01339 [Pseudogymnoascus sp. VKM F-3557]